MDHSRFSRGIRTCLCLFAVVLILAMAGEASIFKLKVTVQAANIRSNPDLRSAVLKVVPQGTLFESEAKEGSWYKVTLPPDAQGNAVPGFIHESLVEVVEEIKEEAQPQETPRPVKGKTVTEPTKPEPPPAPRPRPQPAAGTRGQSMTISLYSKAGLLLTPPTATDLDYIDAEGGSLEEFLDVSTFNFGGGLQWLVPLSRSPQNSLHLGLDLAFQKVFSSVFDTGAAGIIYLDQHKDSNYSFSLLGVVEFRPQGSPMLLQAGAGTHFVLWSYSYDYSSKYTEIHDSSSGMEVNVGFMLGGGVDVPLTDKISLPIMLRMDALLRYGVLLNVSATIGLSIH